MSQTLSDAIADLVWYLHGYREAAKQYDEPCYFSDTHVEALQRANTLLQDEERAER